MGTDAEQAYQQAINQGRSADDAYAAAAYATAPGSGVRTFAYNDSAANLGKPVPVARNPNSTVPYADSYNLTASEYAARYTGRPVGGEVDFDHSLYVQPGFVTSSYYAGMNAALDPTKTWVQRGVNFALATAAAPLMVGEEFSRGILNAPYFSSLTGQQLAAASLSPTTEGRVVNTLGAIQSASMAFLGLGSLAPPSLLMPGVSRMPLPITTSMSAGQLAAVRSTYDTPVANLGNVYSPDFIGPVQWEFFYRGDANMRSEFASSMGRTGGNVGGFLDTVPPGAQLDILGEHGVSSAGSPYISTTRNPAVAEYFARGPSQGQNGYVTTFRIEARDAQMLQNQGQIVPNFENPMAFFEPNPAIGLPEAEYVFRGSIDPMYIYRQAQVWP